MKHRENTKSALAALLLGSVAAQAATWYVSPSGSDSNAGAKDKPFASLAKAQMSATAGDTVWIRGGTYSFTAASNTCGGSQTAVVDAVSLTKSGTKGKSIRYWAYPGETPVFDFHGMKDDCRVKGFTVSGSWIHMKGLEIKGVPQNNNKNHESWAVWVSGSFNTFELLNMHHNMGPGLFIQKGSGNLGLNCDSHHNWDSLTSNGSGQSADGFGVHVSAADTGNILRGCRAWMNTDDGYDLINAFAPVTIEHCIAAYSGYEPGTTKSLAAGNGNGFKMGGYGADATVLPAKVPKHRSLFNLAFNCKANGFYANHHPGDIDFFNNTAINSHVQYDMLGLKADGTTTGTAITVGVFRNNIAYGGTAIADNKNNASDDSQNSWNLAAPAASDFQSLDTAGVFGPRDAEGDIPSFKFAHLATASKYHAAGADVGFGSKPDLGAFPDGSTSVISVAAFVSSAVLRPVAKMDGWIVDVDLPVAAKVRVELLDPQGRKVGDVRNLFLPAGASEVPVSMSCGGLGILRAFKSMARLPTPGKSCSTS